MGGVNNYKNFWFVPLLFKPVISVKNKKNFRQKKKNKKIKSKK